MFRLCWAYEFESVRYKTSKVFWYLPQWWSCFLSRTKRWSNCFHRPNYYSADSSSSVTCYSIRVLKCIFRVVLATSQSMRISQVTSMALSSKSETMPSSSQLEMRGYTEPLQSLPLPTLHTLLQRSISLRHKHLEE